MQGLSCPYGALWDGAPFYPLAGIIPPSGGVSIKIKELQLCF